LDDFAAALEEADHVLVTKIYAARELDTLGVSGASVAELMAHPDAEYVEALEDASQILLDRVKAGDVVITLGAGDGYLIGERLLEGLQARQNEG
jgi:UDP-N-acetylmuramate--alanine ligase